MKLKKNGNLKKKSGNFAIFFSETLKINMKIENLKKKLNNFVSENFSKNKILKFLKIQENLGFQENYLDLWKNLVSSGKLTFFQYL